MRTPAAPRLAPSRRATGRCDHGAMTSTMSQVLAVAILVFVAIGSGVLVWDALAAGVGRHAAGSDSEIRRARVRLAAGVLGLALVLWVALGLLTHAR